MKDSRLRGRKGVSEVVGALMLIIVVVTAVASLSFFLASAQQQAQNRQSYLTSVRNDNLETVYSQFYPNDPTIQWELDQASPSMSTACAPTTTSSSLPVSSWYVQQNVANSAQVELIPNVATLAGTSTSGTTTILLTDSAASWVVNQWTGDVLTYTSGPAQGESETISSNMATTITTPAFGTAPDASGDTFTISMVPAPSPVLAILGVAFSGTTTTGATNTVLQDTTAAWSAGAWVGDILTYASGPAKGESETISDNTATTITTPAFGTAPDPSGGDAFTISTAFYNAISKGEQASLTGAASPFSLAFGSGNCVFEPASWGSITLTVRNTNTEASSITGVQLNGIGSTVWYQVDQAGNIVDKLGATVPLPIPAKTSVDIMFNRTTFGSIPLLKNDSLSISLQSGSGNFFQKTFTYPTALQQSSISAQNYGVISRDILNLVGSQSFAVNSSIQSYEWKLDIPNAAYATANGCTSAAVAAFGSLTNYDTAYASGQTLQYAPQSLFPTHLGDCIIGPIRATLLVSDSNGFQAVSQPIIISPDSNIDPVGSISAGPKTPSPCPSSCTVTVTVDDIFGNPVSGAVVDAVPTYGGVSPNVLSQTTNSLGQVTFTITVASSGSMNFDTGSLLPAQVSFP